MKKMDEPQQVLNELCLKYTKSIKSLRIYLEMSLEQTIKRKRSCLLKIMKKNQKSMKNIREN